MNVRIQMSVFKVYSLLSQLPCLSTCYIIKFKFVVKPEFLILNLISLGLLSLFPPSLYFCSKPPVHLPFFYSYHFYFYRISYYHSFTHSFIHSRLIY